MNMLLIIISCILVHWDLNSLAAELYVAVLLAKACGLYFVLCISDACIWLEDLAVGFIQAILSNVLLIIYISNLF